MCVRTLLDSVLCFAASKEVWEFKSVVYLCLPNLCLSVEGVLESFT